MMSLAIPVSSEAVSPEPACHKLMLQVWKQPSFPTFPLDNSRARIRGMSLSAQLMAVQAMYD